MATLNPAGIVKDTSSSPDHARQIHNICGRITGGGTHVVTIETKLKTLLAVTVYNETDAAALAATEAASTAFPGTRKVTFTVANTKTYNYEIVGYLSRSATVDTTAGATTVEYFPFKGP